jgi:hypothetical protein
LKNMEKDEEGALLPGIGCAIQEEAPSWELGQ